MSAPCRPPLVFCDQPLIFPPGVEPGPPSLFSIYISPPRALRLIPVDIKGEAQVAQRVKQQAEQEQALREKVLSVSPPSLGSRFKRI